jgi:hypothetical protein
MDPAPIPAPADRLTYIVAGNATVTLESRATGKHYTYTVQAPRGDEGRRDIDSDKRFVSLMTAPNVYEYIGFLASNDRDGNPAPWHFVHGRRRAGQPRADLARRAIAWFCAHPESDAVAVYHSGRCGRCGRELTAPESILSGLGPVCRGAA